MLYICIPAYDEASTIGLLLWRIRKVFQEFSREYEIAVYDDGSSDATKEILEPYREVLPLTVLGGPPHRGYGVAVDALCQWAAQRTRYARRDAAVLLQGDFTDQPEHLPELVKRFEGGADIIIAEPPLAALPTTLRRARWAARWTLKPFAAVPGVSDPFATMRLYRISVLREATKRLGDTPLVTATGWVANAELLFKTAPAARRIEVVEFAPRYDLRTRPSRVRPLAEAMAVLRFGATARGLAAAAAKTAATRIARAPEIEPEVVAPAPDGIEAGQEDEARPVRDGTRPARDGRSGRRTRGARPRSGSTSNREPSSGDPASDGNGGRPKARRPKTPRPNAEAPSADASNADAPHADSPYADGPYSDGPDTGGSEAGPESTGPGSGPDLGGGSGPASGGGGGGSGRRRGRRPTGPSDRGGAPSPDGATEGEAGSDRPRRGRGRGRGGRSRPRPVPVEPAAAQTSEPEKR